MVGGALHPGADDNASGTAVVVGLARAFAAAGPLDRTLVFALFGAEEIGLVGSGHYVRQPTVPIDRTVAMLNFDMVGRLGDGKLTVGGVESGRGLRDIVAEAARALAVGVNLRDSPFGPSDHTRFYDAGTPALFFHTGTHADYHRPGDTADKLDAAGMARVAAVGARVAERLAAGDRPAYVTLTRPARGRERREAGAGGPRLPRRGRRGRQRGGRAAAVPHRARQRRRPGRAAGGRRARAHRRARAERPRGPAGRAAHPPERRSGPPPLSPRRPRTRHGGDAGRPPLRGPGMADQDPRDAATLGEMMRRRAAASPDTQYFSLFDETVTYGRLWAQAGRYAAGLARAGVRAGDKVALIYPTCAEFFYTFFGCTRLGAVPVPLYPTLGVEATGGVLRNSDAVVVATIGWFRPGVDESVALAPNVRGIVEPNDLDVEAPAPPDHPAGPDDLAFIQYTSGSTGQPRGVMLTHANVMATCRFMSEAAAITRGGPGGVVAAALSRHGADRLRLHAAAHRHPAVAAAARPAQPARVAGARHARSRPPSPSRPTSATATACATCATPPTST